MKQCFQNKTLQLATRQPKNLWKILTKAKFEKKPLPLPVIIAFITDVDISSQANLFNITNHCFFLQVFWKYIIGCYQFLKFLPKYNTYKFRLWFNNYKSKHRAFRKGKQNAPPKRFHSHYIQGCHKAIDDWEVTLFEKCETHKQLK